MHSDMRIVLAFTVPAVAALLGLLWVLNNKRRPKGGKSDPAVKDAKLSSKSKDISTVSEPVESSFLKKNTVSKAFKESPQESSEIVSHDATCYEGGKNSCLGMMNLQHVHNRHLDSQDILSSINVTVTPTSSIVKLTNSGTCLPLQIIELSETGCSSKNEVKLSESHELSGKSVEEPSFSVGSSFSFSEDVTGPLKSNTPAIAVEKTKSGDAEASALKQESSMESWNVAQSPSSVTDLMITNEVDVSEMNKGYPSDIAVDSDISLCHQQMEATSEVMCFGPLDLGEEKKEDVGEVDSVVQSFPTSPHLYNIESDFSENTCSVGHIAPSSIETPKQSIDALDSNASCDTNTNIKTMENTQEKLGPSLLLTCKKCDTSLGIEDERTSISETFQDLSHGCTSFHSKDVEKPDCGMGLCQTGVKELMATTNSSDPSVSRFSFMFRNTALSHDAEITQTDISNSQQDQASIEGTDCSRTCCDFTCTSTNDVVISGDDVSRTDTSTGHISVITTTESPATESIGNYFPMGENSCKREVNDTDTIAKANFSVYNEDVTVADHLLLSQKQFVSNKSSSPLESKEREEIVSATPPEDITAQITGHSEWQQDFLFSCTVDSLVSNESASATENNLGVGCKNDDFTLLETKVLPPDPFHFTENSSFTCLENIVSENDLPLSEIQESSSLKEAPEAILNDIFGTQLHTSSSYVAEGSDSDCTTELPLNDELLHRRECANNGPVLSIFKEASSVPAKTVSSHIISLEPGDVNSSENNLDAFNQLSSLSCEEPYSDDLLNIYQDRPFMDVETNLEETVLDTSKQLVADICETESKQTVTDVAEQADAYVCETKFEQTVADTGEQAVCDSCEAGLEQTVTDEQVVTDVCVAELEQDARDIQRQIVTNVCEAKLVQIIADTPKQVVTDVCETKLEKTVVDTYKQVAAAICEPDYQQTVTKIAEQDHANVCEIQLEQAIIDMNGQVTDVCETKSEQIETDATEQVVIDVCRNRLEENVLDTHEKLASATSETKLQQSTTGTHEQIVTLVCETALEQTKTDTCKQTVSDAHKACLGQTGIGEQVTDICETKLDQTVTDVYKQVVTGTKCEPIVTNTPEQVVASVCETNLEKTDQDTSKQLVADICETESTQTVTDVAEQADAYVCETEFEQTVADTGEQAVCDSCEAGLEQTVTDEQVATDVFVAALEQDVRDKQRQIVTNVCEAKLVQIIADTPKQVVTDVCETNFEDIVKDVAEQDNASVCATAFEQTEIDTCEQTVSDTHEACLEQKGTVEQVVTDICGTKLKETCEQVRVDICEMKLKFVSDSSEQTVPFVCKADLGCSLTDMPEQEVTDTFDNQEKQEATDICESYSEQTAMNKTDEQSVVDKQDEQAAVDFCKSGLKQSVTYKQDENVVMGVPESKKPLLSKQNDHDVFSVYESNFLQSEKLNEKTGVGIAESTMSLLLRDDEQTVKSCEIKQSAMDTSDGQTVLEPDTIQLALKNHQQDKGFQQSLTDTQDKWVVFAVSESVGQHHATDEKDEHTALTIDMSFKFHEPNCPFPTSPDKMNSLINPLADGNSSSSVGVQESKQQTVAEIVSEHASVVDGPSSLQSVLTNSSWLSNDHSHPEGDDSQDQENSSWLMVESEIKMDVEADLLSVKTRSKDNLSSGLSQHKMANNHRKSQKKKAAGARNPKPSDPHTENKITGGISSPVSKRKKAKSSTKLEKSLKNSSESLKSNVYSSSSSPGSDLKDRVHKASLILENSLQPFSGFDRNNQHLEKDDSENESQSPKDSMQTECSVQLCNGNKQTDHCFQEVQEELSEQDWIGVQISNGSEHMELSATNMASSSSLVAASLVTVEFNFPTDLCGRLIGRNGRNVQHIKEQSGASVIITSNPVSPDFQLCRVQGLHSCVHEALMMIKKKFPQVDVQPILAPNLNPLIMPDMIKLNLPDGVSVKLVVSNIVNAGHIFVQLPNHPTFASLDRLCHCMNSCYTKNQGVPPLPRPVETGVICAAESGGCWFRVEIIGVYPETDECDLAYVDYGGYDRVALSSLRQIRSDFMTLPFQAIECYMANITPLQDEEYFSENASSVLHELTAGKLLDGQVITREGSIPYIHLYQISTRGALLVNREMVNREVVRWIEIF